MLLIPCRALSDYPDSLFFLLNIVIGMAARKSEIVTAAKTRQMKRVVRLETKPKAKALATHGAMHHGQVSRSPTSALQAFALDFSLTSRRLWTPCIQ